MATQAVSQRQQQLVASLVTELFVDAFKVIKPDTQHRNPTLQAAGIDQNFVQLLLKLLAVGQSSEEVVLGHAQQAVLGFVAQMRVAFNRGQQLVGGGDPNA